MAIPEPDDAMNSSVSRELISKYVSLHARLEELNRAPRPDKAAIDQTMADIDAVHAGLKALHSRPGDTQRY
jgi:hypothetical protein